MKFNLKDFLELDTKSLLAVNGGTDCSGSSSPSSPSDSGGGGSGGPGSSTTSSSGSGSGSGGGYCSGASDGTTVYKNTYYDTDKPNTPNQTSKGAGYCSRINLIYTTEGNSVDYLSTNNPDDVHCDVIAWNHAVDAGLDPRGEDGNDWNADDNTVNQIYNDHFSDDAVSFDSNCAGQTGYLFYDWTGDGTYDHVEFASVNSDGTSYSYYSNNGFEQGETYNTRTFADDSNAHARNDGNGVVSFVPLN